ncbi:lipopolysaccharide biosynthesis protein [Oscillospiraceae bacterium 50-16]
MKYDETIGKSVLWNSVGTLFYCGCQWLLTVLVVRLNDDYSDAGILSLAMSIATPLATVAMLNLRTFQVAHIEDCFSDGDFIFTRIITSLVSLIICIVAVCAGRYTVYTSMCIILFVIYRLSEAIVDVLHGIDQRVWRLDIVGKSFLMRGSIMLAVFVIGEYYFSSLFISIVFMALTVYGVILFYDAPACRKSTQLSLEVNYSHLFPLIKIGVPLGAFSFLLTLLSSIPRLFMEHWHGEDILGVFGAITTITLLVPQLSSFIFNPLIPVFAERWKTSEIKGFNKLLLGSFMAIVLIGIVALISGFFLGEWALCLVFGDSIRPYSYLLCPVIGTAIITACIWLFGNILTILGDYNMLAWLSLVSVTGCLFASIILIPENALSGTILATTIGLLIECALLSTRTLGLIYKRIHMQKRTGF